VNLTATGSVRGQLARFIIVGGSNTLATYALLVLLSQWLDTRLAYSIAFVIGVIYSTLLSSRWVFVGERSVARVAAFVAWYLAVWAVGVALVLLFGRGYFGHRLVVSALVLVVTVPLNFLGGRIVLGRAVATAGSRI
jgi:putative flippase GtrA